MAKKRVVGVQAGPFGLSWEYLASKKDLARRVLVFMEDRRVLTSDPNREDFEGCRLSAMEIRRFLTLEIMNVRNGGELEGAFKRMRAAAAAFVSAAGQDSTDFSRDQDYFHACLVAFRDAMGTEFGWLAEAFGFELEPLLAGLVPPQDLSWLPGGPGPSQP